MALTLNAALGTLRRRIDLMGEEVMAAAEQEANDVAFEVEAKAVELAPVETGNLESSSVVEVKSAGGRVRAEIAFAAPYSAEVHELPPERRGPRTEQKPGNELGQAGPKFLERPVRAYSHQFGARVRDAVRRALRGIA
jgi:hypothetical protein